MGYNISIMEMGVTLTILGAFIFSVFIVMKMSYAMRKEYIDKYVPIEQRIVESKEEKERQKKVIRRALLGAVLVFLIMAAIVTIPIVIVGFMTKILINKHRPETVIEAFLLSIVGFVLLISPFLSALAIFNKEMKDRYYLVLRPQNKENKEFFEKRAKIIIYMILRLEVILFFYIGLVWLVLFLNNHSCSGYSIKETIIWHAKLVINMIAILPIPLIAYIYYCKREIRLLVPRCYGRRIKEREVKSVKQRLKEFFYVD